METSQSTDSQNQPTARQTVHDRAEIAVDSILLFLGINKQKVEQIFGIVGLIYALPGWGPIGRLQRELQGFKPLIDAYQQNPDISAAYIRKLPEEHISTLIQNSIMKLEWVIHGDTPTEQSEGTADRSIDATANQGQ